jgi:subtilisin family serine protease
MKKYFLSSLLFSLLSLSSIAQSSSEAPKKEIPQGWHLQDRQDSGYAGISLEKAYAFLKGQQRKSQPVIVAVIDSGIDTLHEDLRNVLWTNTKEIPGNGKDDDKNGYVDDIHGWNFLGGKDGRNVEKDSYEAARVYHRFKGEFEGIDPLVVKFNKESFYLYSMWVRSKKELTGEKKDNGAEMIMMKRVYTNLLKSDSLLRKALGKDTFKGKDLTEFKPEQSDVKKARSALYNLMFNNDALEASNIDFLGEFGDYIRSMEQKEEAGNKAPENYRADIVKDNYLDIGDRYYGNNDIMATNKSALHGTHVSGIIAASRNNNKGSDGVADNVKIMTLRAVPDGDEHDKDIALAIRYAADNGAQIINMSFGKGYSPEKKWVDEAVAYAAQKGVLLVHAAGNDAKNLDTTYNFPTPLSIDGERAENWITVGASGDPGTGGLTASFSNYGKNEVDVFAPGVKIYAPVPGGNSYQFLQGTSMASPVVAGVAALLLEYFPTLSARQLKMVIEQSSVALKDSVQNPGTGEKVLLSDLCRTGGIVNAYEAVKLAATIKGERKLPAGPAKTGPKPVAAPAKKTKGF